MKFKTLALAVGVSALLTAGLTFGVTEASASGPNVSYYACLYKGKLTHVGTVAPSGCPGGLPPISWNSQGPQGPAGTNGTNGAAGPQGPAGPQGSAGATVNTCTSPPGPNLNFNACSISGLDWYYVDVTGTSFLDADLHGSQLFDANFSGDQLSHANFNNAELLAANFSGVTAVDASFVSADLRPNSMTNADLFGSNLTSANMAGDKFVNDELLDVTTTGAVVTGATWSNTICPDFTNSDSDGNTCVGHGF